jgi:hypothetical protein
MANNVITPDTWWTGFDTNIGSPTGPRYSWNNLIRRDFSGGMVLVNGPQNGAVTASLPGTYSRLDGSSVSSISLAAGQGAVFLSSGVTTPPPATSSTFTPIRINAGGGAYTDSTGKLWSADTGYSGGNTYSSYEPISNTSDQQIYQTSRWGLFNYQFSVPNGSYAVNLRFAEQYFFSPGERNFNVSINGSAVLSNFDPLAQAGGRNNALVKSFPVNVSNGKLVLSFSAGSANWPTVNGIEIVAAPATTSSALFRVNAGGGSYTDANGNSWAGDSYYSGGNSYSVAVQPSGTNSPGTYQTSRWGLFSYTFPVPNGNHTVNLKFAEPYFYSAGQRIFSVYINNVPVLTDFDIYAASGGFMKALDLSFPVSVSYGQVQISFMAGSQNWPTVSALEIF